MKRLIISLAILLTALTAMAQHEEGDFTIQPKVGLNIATLSDADKSITDIHLGLEAEYMMSDNLGLGFGAILSNQGAKYDFLDEAGQNKYTVDLDYVHVPILVSYYVLPGLAVKAGIQPGFKMRAKAKLYDDATVDLDDLYKLNHLFTGEDIKVSTFDLSVPVGVSYEYMNFVLDARYNWGLMKVVNVGDAFYNRCFMLSLGYKFALGD